MNNDISRTSLFVKKFILLGVFLFIVFLHLYYLTPGVDAGIHMYGSFLITKGFLPYKYLWNNKPPLIYVIGAMGFLLKSNPFLGVRIIELAIFSCNLLLVKKIVRAVNLREPFLYLLTFSAIYLVSWEQGFLTETFAIPLALAALYLLIRKVKHYELICAFLLTLSFLLKQNAVAVVAGIMLVDIFSNYRQNNKTKKIIKYSISLLFFSLLLYLLLSRLGIWNDFIDQVFIYNIKYEDRSSFGTLIVNHIRRNSFLSVKGISTVLFFNICILLTLWKYGKMKRDGYVFELKDWLLVNLIIIYIASYYFVYMSGKSYPHYFMLLIVPATFIMGHYAAETKIGKITLGILLIVGFISNISAIPQYKKIYENRKTVVYFLKNNTPADEFIHIAGFGNQYIYVMADRLSHTKFILPLFENNGYTTRYKSILVNDFEKHPPLFIILNKNNYKQLDPNNFYTEIVMKTLQRYRLVYENELYIVYKRN